MPEPRRSAEQRAREEQRQNEPVGVQPEPERPAELSEEERQAEVTRIHREAPPGYSPGQHQHGR
jgi:hypothetical protein